MVLGAVFANVLTDLKLTQFLDYVRADEQRDQHRGEAGEGGAEGQIPEDAKGSEVRKKLLIKEPVEQTSSGKTVGFTAILQPGRSERPALASALALMNHTGNRAHEPHWQPCHGRLRCSFRISASGEVQLPSTAIHFPSGERVQRMPRISSHSPIGRSSFGSEPSRRIFPSRSSTCIS